jgi:hypothetical protein
LTHDVASCEETRIRQGCGQHGDEGLSSRNEEPTREQRAARRVQKIARLREQLEEKDRELDILRARLVAGPSDRAEGMDPEKVIWIFGTGRSGTSWLASMIGEFGALWNEPLVGALFGEFYYERAAHRRGEKAILGESHRDLWLGHIRTVVLEGAGARYPGLSGYLTIKEPHGSTGAPLLSEALPESRLIVLIRDPRDVAASAADAHSEGSWARQNLGKKKDLPPSPVKERPVNFVKGRARVWLRDISKAVEAYRSHAGPKVLVRYEDLRANTLDEMRRICREIGIPAEEDDLASVVAKHSWEMIPEEEKGEGKFYRKAKPGSWREDLTPEQAKVVEQITSPLFKEFYAD